MNKRTTTGAAPAAASQPARQGFYMAILAKGERVVAEWREYDKAVGKCWWQHVSAEPTQEKAPVPLENVVGYENVNKTIVEQALKRAPTLDETIEAAYHSYVSSDEIDLRYNCDIPPARMLKVGDELMYGNLDEVKVVAVRDEGRVIVFSYHKVESKSGQTIDHGTQYRATYWTEVLPKANGSSAFAKETKIYGAYSNSTLKSIISRALRGMDDTPKYQRDYTWALDDKERFLESVFAGRELGRFIFVQRPYPHVDQVLDGKQRINCLMEFVTSRIAYKGLFWHELSHSDRRRFEGRSVQFADLQEVRFTPADLMEIFLEVNVAGVPQSEEHLASVRQMLDEERAKEGV